MSQLPPTFRHQINQSGGLSNDTRALMLFEANKKTALVAYLLWFFLGWLGAHNFYLRRTGVAVAQLILTITAVGIATLFLVLSPAMPGAPSRRAAHSAYSSTVEPRMLAMTGTRQVS